MNVCFFCRTKNPDVLQRNEFYAVDLRILQELGHRVQIATKALAIPRADLYFVWWWTWACFPLVRAKLLNRPVIVVGTFDHLMPNGKLERFYRRPWWHRGMLRFVLRNADANIVNSQDQKDFLQAHFRVRGLDYSPHVVDTDVYCPGESSREKFFLTFCWLNTRNSRRKCIPEAIQAAARLHADFPDYRLLVCGEKGNDYPGLAKLVDELGAGDFVEFRGVVTKEEKIELMQRCGVYLQPSRAEGFGLAILEAMSCGAPIVTSPVGAVPALVADTVEMADGTDPDDIANGVRRLLRDADLRIELGRKARIRAVQEYSYIRRRQDFERIIERVMSRA